MQIKEFIGISLSGVVAGANDWLKRGKKKEIVWFNCGVYIKKSSFSGCGEEEVFFFVYHYKIVKV